jgi:hypothetical protein
MGGKIGRPRIINRFGEKEIVEHKAIKRLKKCILKIRKSIM